MRKEAVKAFLGEPRRMSGTYETLGWVLEREKQRENISG